MSIKKEKAYAKRLYQLGWEENDHYNWRCAKCKRLKMHVDCGICKRCEHCYKCKPDTEAGQQALRDYKEKRIAIINFDVFGEKKEG